MPNSRIFRDDVTIEAIDLSMAAFASPHARCMSTLLLTAHCEDGGGSVVLGEDELADLVGIGHEYRIAGPALIELASLWDIEPCGKRKRFAPNAEFISRLAQSIVDHDDGSSYADGMDIDGMLASLGRARDADGNLIEVPA